MNSKRNDAAAAASNDASQPEAEPSMPNAANTVAHAAGGGRLRLIVLLVVVGALFAAGRMLPLDAYAAALRSWIDGLGAWGLLAFALIYVLATILALPGAPLTLLAGALFGGLLGTVVVSLASTAGAAAAFLIARYVARNAITVWLGSKPMFQKLDGMTARRGAAVVAVTRLVPLFPFNLLNYGFGLTRVGFWTFTAWSWLCMLPGTILYVVGTDALVQAVAAGRIPWPAVAAVTATLAILAVVGRRLRQRFDLQEE